MRFSIGSMTVGDILDRSLKLLFGRFATFYAIGLTALLPVLVVQLLLPEMIGSGVRDPSTVVLTGLGIFVLIVILQLVANGATLRVVSETFADRKVGVLDALGFAFGRLGSLFITAFLFGLAVFVGVILMALLMIVVHPAVGLLVGVPLLIAIVVWYIFGAQVVVAEGRAGVSALSRSKQLVSGFFWRVLGILLLVGIVMAIIQGACDFALGQAFPVNELVPAGGGAEPDGAPFAAPQQDFRVVFNYPNYVIVTLISGLVTLITNCYLAICTTLLYYDLRIRKEGYDLEVALGRGPEMAEEAV